GFICDAVRKALSLDDASLAIACTHAHASPRLGTDREPLPGGDLLPGYRKLLIERVTEAAREAIDSLAPATIPFATGKATLATNRDLRDPDPQADRFICGY